jgi:hypothetical protein
MESQAMTEREIERTFKDLHIAEYVTARSLLPPEEKRPVVQYEFPLGGSSRPLPPMPVSHGA